MIFLFIGLALLVAYAIWRFEPRWPPLKQILSAAGITAFVVFMLRVGLGRLLGVLGILSAFAPIINHLYFKRAANSSAAPAAITRKDAAELLGVDEAATEEEIEAAYRKLMTRVHPDTGGSAVLARQLNAARDVLLSK